MRATKISELISCLQQLQDSHGDLPVSSWRGETANKDVQLSLRNLRDGGAKWHWDTSTPTTQVLLIE